MRAKKHPKSKKGFTLIELLVVISIIGFLSTLAVYAVNVARTNAKYAKVKKDIETIRTAMKMYEMDVGELPPRGDSCPSCSYPNAQAAWNTVINAMLNNDGAGWNGPYLTTAISQDPWGHHFIYDDNACRSNCGDSRLSTAGADGLKGTGDDYQILVTGLSEVTDCCY